MNNFIETFVSFLLDFILFFLYNLDGDFMLKITKNIEEANLITHSGKFHADDVFSTAFLSEFITDPVVCRINTINDEVNNDAIIYDVGFGKFDHHQKDFNVCHENGVKCASFGLLFKEYGRSYLEKINSKYADVVYSMIEHELVEGIDAVDNGEFPVVEAPYSYKSYDGIIGDFNAVWNENIDNDLYFMEAVAVARMILSSVIKRCFAKAQAKEKVDLAIENSNNHIMYLDEYMPFKDFVISSNSLKAKDIYFCITPSNRGGYCIHTIPIAKNTYETRCDFPSSWGGLIDEELQEVSGVKSATFCHSSLFLAVCMEENDAYLMANLAINANNSKE